MNIVFVSTLFPPRYYGGAEILTQIIAEALVKKGHRVTVYTSGKNSVYKKGNVVIKQIRELVPSSPLRSTLTGIYKKRLRRRLLNEQEFISADIVHAVDMASISDLAGWWKIKDKLVVTIQDYGLVCPAGDLLCHGVVCPNYCHKGKGFVCLNGSIKRASYRIRRRIHDAVLKNLRYVICVSNFVANEVRKVSPNATMKVIGNCVSDTWFSKRKPVQKDIDLLYVGRLEKYKGIDTLLLAIAEMNTHRHVRAVFVGGGSVNEYIFMAHTLGLTERVSFIGVVPYGNIASFYRRAKIVLSPSLWPEPCGRTIVEAMAVGCPVVATSAGGTPETMIDGKHGILVAPNQPHEIADACIKLLENTQMRMNMGKLAKIYAKKKYTIHNILRQYESFYDLIIHSK